MTTYPDLHPPQGTHFPFMTSVYLLLLFLSLAMLQLLGTEQSEFFTTLHQFLTRSLPRGVWKEVTLLGDTWVLLCLMTPWLTARPSIVYALIATVPLGGLASVFFKKVIQAPRPHASVLSNILNLDTGQAIRLDSFPSGHSITAFAAFAVIGCALMTIRIGHWKRLLLVMAGIAATAVALSRVALAAHWPLDIMAGATIGWLAGRIGVSVVRRYSPYLHSMHLNLLIHLAIFASSFALLLRTTGNADAAVVCYGAIAATWVSFAQRLWQLKVKKKRSRVMLITPDVTVTGFKSTRTL
jgi:membrane-associated phospholipid phosphatase